MTTVLIPLRRRGGDIVAHAIVDVADEHLVRGHGWSMHKEGYAHARIGGRLVLMHRHILGLTVGDRQMTDHRNRNRLDNRRLNLRLCTRALNMQNQGSNRGSTSRFRGVSWDKARCQWRSYAQVDGILHDLGRFDDERVAAKVASRFRKQHMPFAIEAA